MPDARELITDFRETVERVIDKELANSPYRPMFSGAPDIKMAGLVFSHIKPGQSRDIHFGSSSAEIWGVATDKKLRIAGHMGHVSIVSTADANESLTRVACVTGPLSYPGYELSAPIEGADTIKKAVDWMQSPHLYTHYLDELVQLTEEEATRLEGFIDADLLAWRDFEAEMARIDEATRINPGDLDIRIR